MEFAKRTKVLLAAAAAVTLCLSVLGWRSISVWLAPQQPLEKIAIALSNNYPGSGLLFVAAAKGFYAQEGLEVAMQPYTSGRDALNAALEKRADLGTAGDIPIVFAAIDNRPVSVVATIFTAGGAHGIVARRDRGISTLADLKGKIVGVTKRTDSDFILGTMVARNQVSLNELRIEAFPPEAMVEALKSGTVDAISTWEPWLTVTRVALGDGGVEFRTESSFALNFSLAGNTEWTRANPIKIQRLLKALLRAKQFTAENQDEARVIMVKALNLDPSVFEAVGPRYRFVVQLSQGILILHEDMARWAIQNKLTDRTTVPSFLNILSLDDLAEVQPDAVTIIR